MHVAAAVRRGSEGPSEGIRRIRRGLPEEEPSATAERIASREIGRVAKKRVTFRRAAKSYTLDSTFGNIIPKRGNRWLLRDVVGRDGEGLLADLFEGAKRSVAGDENPVDVRGDVVDGFFACGAVRERDADEIVHFLGVALAGYGVGGDRVGLGARKRPGHVLLPALGVELGRIRAFRPRT